MSGRQLSGSPHRQMIIVEANTDTLSHLHELPIGVAADKNCAVSEFHQSV